MDWNLAQEKVLKGEASGFVVKDNLSDLYLLVATRRLLSRLHL